MFCGRCALRVERALRCVRGVADARVNRVAGMVTVSLPTGAIETAALIAAVRAAGYDAEPIHTDALDDARALEQMFLERLRQERQAIIVAVGLTAPVVALAYLGPALQSGRPGAAVWWVTLQGMLAFMLLLSPAGAPLLVAGLRAILHGFFHPDLLIGLAVTAAFAGGVRAATIGHPHGEGFVTVAMILTVINIGRNLETRLRRALVRTTDAEVGPGDAAASALRRALADDLAVALIPVTIIIAVLTLLIWSRSASGAWSPGLRAALAVLVSASPSALGLAPSLTVSTVRPSVPFRTAS
ncbi:MAG TPA: cation transporter, partial [Phycisphaerae bacterium]